jgi:3'(2'), 5'-bisphosphate nucleotidase
MCRDNYIAVGNLVKLAGQKSLELRQQGMQVHQKGFDDYVTNVDRELDQWLSNALRELFPDHCIISEENPNSFLDWEQHWRSYWLIDPIDGTEDFIHHKGSYAVMAGLLENGLPQLGFIYAPVRQQLYVGGAIADRLAIATGEQRTEPTNTCHIILSHKDQRNYGAAILQAVPHAKFYSLGSFGLKVLEVVMGRACAYLYLNRRVKLWDTVAPLAIARSANLVCTDLRGVEIQFHPSAIDRETLTHYQEVFVAQRHFSNRYRERIYHALKKCGYYG